MTSAAADTLPRVADVLADPSISRPLKLTLEAWLSRDPVDAAADAKLLAAVLGRRADALLGRSP